MRIVFSCLVIFLFLELNPNTVVGQPLDEEALEGKLDLIDEIDQIEQELAAPKSLEVVPDPLNDHLDGKVDGDPLNSGDPAQGEVSKGAAPADGGALNEVKSPPPPTNSPANSVNETPNNPETEAPAVLKAESLKLLPQTPQTEPGQVKLVDDESPIGEETEVYQADGLIKEGPLDQEPPVPDEAPHHFIKIGFEKPTFDSQLKYYEDLYGTPPTYPVFKVDWYFAGIPVGFGFSGGYYHDSGVAAAQSSPADGKFEEDELDENQELSLTLIPLQFKATGYIPLLSSFLSLDLWGGVEFLHVQEARHTKVESSGGSTQKTFVNRGTNQNIVLGAGLNIRIDQLDRYSRQSLDFMGIKAIYMTPYFEVVTPSKKTMGPFGRNVVGLMFSFEGV